MSQILKALCLSLLLAGLLGACGSIPTPTGGNPQGQSVASTAGPSHASAQVQPFNNGYFIPATGTFYHTNIGGDPLVLAHDKALAQARVAAFMPSGVATELLARMKVARADDSKSYLVQAGDRFRYMLSGNGWIAEGVVAVVSDWKPHMSRRAWSVYYTDPNTGHEWKLTVFEGCNNLLIDREGPPLICICVTGDACPKRT